LRFCPPGAKWPGKRRLFCGAVVFWCTEAIFEDRTGVTFGCIGVYAGRRTRTGLILILPKPAMTNCSYLFWEAHDPTQVDRQGADIGKPVPGLQSFTPNDQQRGRRAKIKAPGAKVLLEADRILNHSSGIISSGAMKIIRTFCRKTQAIRHDPTSNRTEA